MTSVYTTAAIYSTKSNDMSIRVLELFRRAASEAFLKDQAIVKPAIDILRAQKNMKSV
jgi:hypothetical protein